MRILSIDEGVLQDRRHVCQNVLASLVCAHLLWTAQRIISSTLVEIIYVEAPPSLFKQAQSPRCLARISMSSPLKLMNEFAVIAPRQHSLGDRHNQYMLSAPYLPGKVIVCGRFVVQILVDSGKSSVS